jgi:chromosome segregation ATPase
MKMGYINKSKTLLLLLLLFIVLIAFGAQTIFYQKSLQGVNHRVEQKETEISNLNKKLVFLISNITTLEKEYDLSTKREEDLTGQYSTMKDIKENITIQKIGVEKELNKTNVELDDARSEISYLEKDILKLESNIKSMNATMASLTVDIEDLQKDLDKVTDDAKDICSEIEGVKNVSTCRYY